VQPVKKKRKKIYISKNKKILLELVKQEEKKDKEKDGND
jgi:hypothetical protein